MSDPPSTGDGRYPEIIDGLEQPRPGHTSARVRGSWTLASSYRVRSIVLEARVRQLEARLQQREQQLQETIRRYENLLQRPDEDWVVVTNDSPEMESTAGDD
ncbi:hypothetical protein [Salinibaculum rarum]|uniref:hypothetical protein n=1 Tax=Salinibaculum rarum TaxID=3058903 RepID=UPI00265FE723|nr:hypothetical protein [Salinibaculum sp. KK48]